MDKALLLDTKLTEGFPEPAVPLLLVEDERIQQEILTLMLTRWGYAVTTVGNGHDALTEILTGKYSLVITDRGLPGLDGLQLCKAVRAAGLPSYVYILMLTGFRRATDAVAGLMAGADDYVTKPPREEELLARLIAGRRILTLERSLRDANERIRLMTITDPLVGIFNRRYFDDQLPAATAHTERYDRPLSLAFVDVDHFKLVNDTYGHAVGDEVLIDIARRLSGGLRASDWVARYGGEEFAVVLPETDPAEAMSIAERLRTSIADRLVCTSVGDLTVTASFGVASSQPAAFRTPLELVGAADMALYLSKAQGRNRSTLSR